MNVARPLLRTRTSRRSAAALGAVALVAGTQETPVPMRRASHGNGGIKLGTVTAKAKRDLTARTLRNASPR